MTARKIDFRITRIFSLPLSCLPHRWISMLMLLAVLLPCRTLLAQIAGEGAIVGRITDPTGAVIPNAKVTVVEDATQISTSRTSTSAGDYSVTPLPVGEYTISVTAPGFSKAVQEHVQVNGNQSVGLDFKLIVGKQSETLMVTTAPPELQTTNATLGEVMDNKTYENLPLIMNSGPLDPTAFVTLMNGVAPVSRSGSFNGGGGSAGRTDEIYLDGVPLTLIDQQGDNRNVQLGVSLDAVNQFQVVVSGQSVQFDGFGAANWTTKSGTNQYHGSFYTAFRNTLFDAWSYFAKSATTTTLVNGVPKSVPIPKPAENQDEESFTVGGPVRIPFLYNGKDKLFFLASYVHYHENVGVNPSLYSVPTSLERAGNFTQLSDNAKIYDPTSTVCDAGDSSCTNTKYPGNIIPAAAISPQSQYLMSFLPLPTNDNVTQNNLLTGIPQGNANWTFDARVDYQATQRQHLSFIVDSGKRSFLPFETSGNRQLPIPYAGGQNVTENTATGIIEDDYVISDHAVNNFRYAYDRFWGPAGNLTQGITKYELSTAGFGNLPPGEASNSFPEVVFNGFADNPSTWYDEAGYLQNVNTYDLVDNLVTTHGKHNITYGAIFQWLNENESNHDTATAPMFLSYSNVNTAGYNAAGLIQNTNSGNPFASFLVGAINFTGFTIQPFTTLGARYKAFSPYVQDDWRITPKLTLNLGIRWDLFTPYEEVENRWSYMNPHMINPATGTYGAIEFAGYGVDSCGCKTPIHTYFGNFGPRLGFAYSATPKTVIRGALDIIYSHAGGTGGAGGANNGSGQVGLTASANFPSSGQAGAIPAFYVNNSPAFQAAGISNVNVPAYSPQPFINPIVNAGNYINSGINPQVNPGVAVTAQGVGYADPTIGGRAPYAETYNFGVQREITSTLTASLDYSGSESHFIYGGSRGAIINQLNPQYEVLGPLLKQLPNSVDPKTGQSYLREAQAIVGAGNIGIPYPNFGGPQATIAAMLQPMPQYGGISDTYGDVGNATYDSIQFQLAQRPWHGLSYTVNYTYSKEWDDSGTFRSGWAIPGNVMTDGIPRKQDQIDRSLGASEIPQMLHIYGVWNIPGTHDHGGVINALTNGWMFSSIFSYYSGSPLAITANGCQVIGQGTCMPSYSPNYHKSPRIHGGWGKGINALTAATTPYIDATAFTIPNQTYQIGNISRTGAYNLFGPGGFDLDSAINRTFKIHDSISVVLTATATNVTNAVHWNIASTTLTPAAVTAPGINSLGTNTKSNFGTIGGQSNAARDWQFSGKVVF
jgi:hypothetical protein